ncbi:MAG: patatin-like phospholipase family protein [Myxococcota bacterium]|nr:patatin-like phospholipase family protein [Myxococcota bacterium]
MNQPITQITPEQGYRQFTKPTPDTKGAVWLALAFSGGGTRAAAFAYGVLEELRATEVVLDGQSIRLIDEIDTISAVSGGTFPAAYFGLFGDRLFEDFESKFLYRNIQRSLIFEALRPKNLVRLLSPSFSRSLLAMEYYDRKVFDGATFADLQAAPGPHVHINATDLSHGFRFTFNQGQFDVICSDLDSLPVSAAVAASSAVPVLLSPITLKNYAGTCGFQSPRWILESLDNQGANRRRYEAALSFVDFANAETRPYIHLIDGGIADNLGLRYSIELAEATGGADRLFDIVQREPPDHFVVIVVNAETSPNPGIDMSSASPSFASLMNSVSGSQIRRYNLETLLLTEVSLKKWAQILSEKFGKNVDARLIEIDFDSIPQEESRDYFKLIPTSFVLSDQTVDNLRSAGRDLLRTNPNFREFLQNLEPDLPATPSKTSAEPAPIWPEG